MTASVCLRPIVSREHHPLLISTFDGLPAGAAMEFVNHHHPLPPLDPIVARYGDAVEITYRQRDPGAIGIDLLRAG